MPWYASSQKQRRKRVFAVSESFKLSPAVGENDARSDGRQDRPVWRAKTTSHNGKICVNGGVIKHPSYARMCVAVADVETGL